MNINVNNKNKQQIIIDIEGVIGLDETLQFQTDTTNPRVSTFEKFRTEIEKINPQETQNLRLNIRSMGGSVQDALLIHSMLVELGQSITIETHCYGFSASAATIIAQAATKGKRYVAGSVMYMIHNASMMFDGNSAEATSAAELLAKTDQQIAQIYAQRSGMPAMKFTELMAKDNGLGEWLTAEQTVEMGLADQLENPMNIKNVVNNIGRFFRKIFNVTENQEIEQNVDGQTAQEIYKEIIATETKTMTNRIEDPVIEHYSVQLTGNNSAYSKDVELFRGR